METVSGARDADADGICEIHTNTIEGDLDNAPKPSASVSRRA